jgi:hypothetical protein
LKKNLKMVGCKKLGNAVFTSIIHHPS